MTTKTQRAIFDATLYAESDYLSQSEVAEHLGCSRQNVSFAFQAIRKAAREYFDIAA